MTNGLLAHLEACAAARDRCAYSDTGCSCMSDCVAWLLRQDRAHPERREVWLRLAAEWMVISARRTK